MHTKTVNCASCNKAFKRGKKRPTKSDDFYCNADCRERHGLKLTLAKVIGKRFGSLIILSYSGKDGNGRNMCLTRCDCGIETIKSISHVKTGKSTRCDRYCVAENIAKKKIEKDIIDAKKEKRITNSVKVFIRENNDCSDEYIDEIMKVYRLDKQEVLDILVEKQKGLQNDN